jgi:cell division protein FtsI (penicillin-binding protein 3)
MPVGSGSFRTRIILLGALFMGCAALLSYRLYVFQWVERDMYREQATRNHQRTISVLPQRGSIFDANGNPLAVTVQLDAVSITGKDLAKDPLKANQSVQKLAGMLGIQPQEVQTLVEPEREDPVVVRDQLPAALADQIRYAIDDGSLPGVSIEPRPVRQYPEGSIAPQLLGFIGRDRDGLAGLEFQFDAELRGEPGIIETEVDTTDKEIILARRIVQAPREGSDLVLTVDRYVQRVLERELAEAVRANKASGGLIMVMEPATGAILGMASLPTFAVSDPMVIREGEEMLQKAVGVTNQYEPGSVMKLVTMATALELGLVTPNTIVNDNGIVTFRNAPGQPVTTIKNWDLRANGPISMTEVLVRSSNVGTAQVAQMIGPEKLYESFSQFGFGERTGVQLPGEVPGTVRTPDDASWTIVDQVTNAYGQGIAVTPMQMLTAVAAIGNDGVLMRPSIIKQMDGPDGMHRIEPQEVRRVISSDTARTLRNMMVTVINQPGLQAHRITGITVAGKTGTADFPTNLGYTTGKTFASIVALLPAEQPKLAILVRLDAPEAIYGGTVAAPVLKRVGSDLAAYYRIPMNANGP